MSNEKLGAQLVMDEKSEPQMAEFDKDMKGLKQRFLVSLVIRLPDPYSLIGDAA